MWFWIIYFAIGFILIGIATWSVEDDHGALDLGSCLAALIIGGAFWPLVILVLIGRGIGESLRDNNDSTKHD